MEIQLQLTNNEQTWLALCIILLFIPMIIWFTASTASYNKRKKPIIIAIEGLDGSGKQTITNKLWQELLTRQEESQNPVHIAFWSFPMYDKWHSLLVKWYLNGKFGKDPMKVSPYLSSLTYSIDRLFAWFKLKIDYHKYDYMIFDRYTTSSIYYQAVKADTYSKKNRISKFITFIEYTIFRIPRPDYVIVLNTSVARCISNMQKSRDKLDIHETEYLLSEVSASMAHFTEKFGWMSVDTEDENGDLRTPQEIAKYIVDRIYEEEKKREDNHT